MGREGNLGMSKMIVEYFVRNRWLYAIVNLNLTLICLIALPITIFLQ